MKWLLVKKYLSDYSYSFLSFIFLGTSFKRIYPEEGVAAENPSEVKKIVFCSGKTFYDLFNERKNNKLDSQIAIVRIEQLCPFPFDLIRAELEKYKNAKVCFAQEEHKNMGPVSFFFGRNSSFR
jgi:2-oxoglutarate dehydrogenase E1 component